MSSSSFINVKQEYAVSYSPGSTCFSVPSKENTEHVVSMMDNINRCRKNKYFCDAVISVDGKQIFAHKIVLSSSAKYFEHQINKTSGTKYFSIWDISADSLEKCIDFMYTGHLDITVESASELFTTAYKIEYIRLQNLIIQFMASNITAQCCLVWRKLAQKFKIMDLEYAINLFAVRNIKAISTTGEFKQVGFDYLSFLLPTRSQQISSEIISYLNIILTWIKYDQEKREIFLVDLLKFINITRIPVEDLRVLCSYEPLLQKSEDINYHILLQGMNSLSLGEPVKSEPMKRFSAIHYQKKLEQQKKHRPQGQNPTFSAFQNMNISKPIQERPMLRAKHSYMKNVARNTSLPTGIFKPVSGTDTLLRSGFPTAICTHHQCITAMKEHEDESFEELRCDYLNAKTTMMNCMGDAKIAIFDKKQSALQIYQLKDRSWTSKMSVHDELLWKEFAVVCCKNYIYVFLDNRDCARLDYTLPNPKWQKLTSMRDQRHCPRAVSWKNKIYLIGGGTGILTSISSCECFDSELNKWTSITSMEQKRALHTVTAVEGQIYAIGGTTRSASLTTIERYSTMHNQWQTIHASGQYTLERYDAVAVSISNRIFILGNRFILLGGRTGNDFVPTSLVECYDVVTNIFTNVRRMNLPRLRFSAVTFSGKIFAIGGHSGSSDSVEMYDPKSQSWVVVETLKNVIPKASIALAE